MELNKSSNDLENPFIEEVVSTRIDSSEVDKVGSYLPMVTFAIIIGLGGFIFGYDLGSIGGVIESPAFVMIFGDDNGPKLKDFTKGALMSTACIGACSGSILTKFIAMIFGLKISIVVACSLYFGGTLIVLISTDWRDAIWGRLLVGNANGIICTVCPMFISDLSPVQHRGQLVSIHQLMTTIGILIGACSVFYSVQKYDDTETYQYMYPCFQCLGFSCLIALLIWFVPESPVWYINSRNKNYLLAARSLACARGLAADDVDIKRCIDNIIAQSAHEEALEEADSKLGCHEMNTIDINRQRSDNEQEAAIIETDKTANLNNITVNILEPVKKKPSITHGQPKYLARMFTGIALWGFQQFTGINYFFFYGTTIFSQVDIRSPFLIPVFFGCVNLLFSITGVFTISYFHRTSLLLFGCSCMLVLMISFSTIGITISNTQTGALLMILTSCGFIGSFAMTWGPITSVIISELYPSSIKVKAMSICGATNWLFNFIITISIPAVTKYIGFGLGYIFCVFLLLSIVFVHYIVPETKGISIETLNEKYRNKTFRRKYNKRG